MVTVAGYDVGGAHLKIARLEDGRVTGVRQIACPLWQGLDRLDAALAAAGDLTSGADKHALTMTAELTEIFPSRAEGTQALIAFFSRRFGNNTRFFSGLRGFVDAASAKDDPASVASANFLATARAVAQRKNGALLVDVGSTTCDIVACDRPQGLTDAERLQTGELVYTGFTRTPVPSVATRAPLLGAWQGLARDAFATMADVRRILGELPEDVDLHETADGRGKSVGDSLRRFARGFGRDADERRLKAWQAAAAFVREEQMKSILEGALQVLSRPGLEVTGAIAAGIGAPAAEAIARRLGLPSTTFGSLVEAPPTLTLEVTRHAPAVAVAKLSGQGM